MTTLRIVDQTVRFSASLEIYSQWAVQSTAFDACGHVCRFTVSGCCRCLGKQGDHCDVCTERRAHA